MKKENVALIGSFLNLFLSFGKIFVGILLNSKAILADGLHSFIDFFSSLISYFGIKIAQKKENERYKYGYYSVEALSSSIIVVIIFISSLAIIWEGFQSIMHQEKVKVELVGFLILLISIFLNEGIARLKFSVGKKEKSLALIADAEHSRVDVLSSFGVILSLFLVNYFPFIDGISAIIIGVFILYESYPIGKEAIDSLLGAIDEEAEEKIKNYCKSQNIELVSIKTRKAGPVTFAEIEIKFPRNLLLQEVEKRVKKIREDILKQVKNLKYITIEVSSHDFGEAYLRPRFLRQETWLFGEGVSLPQKEGYRVLIPWKDGKVFNDFGAPEYLLIDMDKENKKIIKKSIVKNPYFGKEERARAMRIVKASLADEVITQKIGEQAIQRLKEFGIKLRIIKTEDEIKDLIK
ncbi:MAG: cation diffusion facilitator family transporter [Candidatus Micrarchaeia archaeon]